MSENERDPNGRLAAREIETEKMAQELMGMAMYENGMSYDDMKKILSFITESKHMAGIEDEEHPLQEIAEFSPEIITSDIPSKSNSIQESRQNENSLPEPSFSYRQALQITPVSTYNAKSPPDIKATGSSHESSSDIFDNPKAARVKSNAESMFDALLESSQVAEDKNDTKLPSTSHTKNAWNIKQDNSQIQNKEFITKAKHKPNQKFERWRLNPLNVIVEDNDVPLQQKERPVLEEKIPMRFCHVPRALEASDKILAVLSYHLEEVAELWRQNDMQDVSDIQLEAPIQVGTDNGSLDVNPTREVAKTHTQVQKSNVAGIPERNCKRKAAQCISRLIDDFEDESGSDFEIMKKSRPAPKSSKISKSIARNSEQPLTRQQKMFNNLSASKTDDSFAIDACDSDEFDNDDLHSLRSKNAKKIKVVDTVTISPESYPRRVVPPNPFKLKTSLQSKKNANASNTDSKRRPFVRKNMDAIVDSDEDSEHSTQLNDSSKNPSKLNDDEISIVLSADEDIDAKVDNVEIKPLPLGLAAKLSTQQSRLRQAKQREAAMAEAQKQAELNAREEEKRRNEDVLNKRLQLAAEEREKREAKIATQKAREQLWKESQHGRDRERRQQQILEKQKREAAEEDRLLQDQDDDPIFDGISSNQANDENQVPCPICQRNFSADDIENHAASCTQFIISDDDEENGESSHRNGESHDIGSPYLTCNICLRFKTLDGILYEEHIHNCLSKKQSTSDAGPSSAMIIDFPTSPIRSFVPISEQTDSEIDYARQFPVRVKPVKPSSRRKR